MGCACPAVAQTRLLAGCHPSIHLENAVSPARPLRPVSWFRLLSRPPRTPPPPLRHPHPNPPPSPTHPAQVVATRLAVKFSPPVFAVEYGPAFATEGELKVLEVPLRTGAASTQDELLAQLQALEPQFFNPTVVSLPQVNLAGGWGEGPVGVMERVAADGSPAGERPSPWLGSLHWGCVLAAAPQPLPNRWSSRGPVSMHMLLFVAMPWRMCTRHRATTCSPLCTSSSSLPPPRYRCWT